MKKLEEAINHCEEVALSCAKSNRECALEHVQLMQWLKELHVLRQLVKPEYLQVIREIQKIWVDKWEEEFNRKLIHLEIDINKLKENYGDKKKSSSCSTGKIF